MISNIVLILSQIVCFNALFQLIKFWSLAHNFMHSFIPLEFGILADINKNIIFKYITLQFSPRAFLMGMF